MSSPKGAASSGSSGWAPCSTSTPPSPSGPATPPRPQTEAFGGKWIEISALDARFTSFDQFLNAADLVTAAFEGHTAPLTVSRATTYEGHKVVIVKDTVTTGGKKSTGLMYIAAAGPAYVFKIVDDTPGEVGALAFSHYDKAVPLTVPPNAINLT